MSAPFIRRRTYMRRFTELAQSYRREVDQAKSGQAKAEARLQQWVDALVPRVSTEADYRDGGIRIVIDVARNVIEREPRDGLNERLARTFLERLHSARRDYRGDLRQTDTQRALGISPARVNYRASQAEGAERANTPAGGGENTR